MKTFTAEQIRQMLLSQEFSDWYDTVFKDYVSGERDDKDTIIEHIESML